MAKVSLLYMVRSVAYAEAHKEDQDSAEMAFMKALMLYRRGKKGTWYYSFEFGGKRIHESSKSTSKTVAREAERSRRRQLELTYNQITKRTLPPSFERAAGDWSEERPSPI